MMKKEIRTFETICQEFKKEQRQSGKVSSVYIGVSYELEDLNPQATEAFYHYVEHWQTEHLVLSLSCELATLIDQYEGLLETTEEVKQFLITSQLSFEGMNEYEIGAIKAYALGEKLGIPLVRILEEEV